MLFNDEKKENKGVIIMKIREDHKYYIDEYKTFNEFIKEFVFLVKDKKIKKFIPSSGLSWCKRDYSDKIYDTDMPNYLMFEDNTILVFDYNVFSMIDILYTSYECLNKNQKEIIDNQESFEIDCYGETIVDYELNKFSDEYIIEPSGDTIRPEGGDYFKELIFHLSNNKKICICAENAETDGYCNIWMENDNLRGVFNGDPHKAWWN